jgi:hypothetical protein
MTGAIGVRYAIRVSNPAEEPITLRQISAQSIGIGAYSLAPSSLPFDVTVAPNGSQDVEFWANAFVSQVTTVGANGPVTLRLNLVFETPLGKFEEIVVRQVNERAGHGDTGPG